jgi:tetratricopeptide (TPR) repeat protein
MPVTSVEIAENPADSSEGFSEFDAAVGRAKRAAFRKDWQETFRWWDAARALSPKQAAPYLSAGNALRALGRLDEAETLLSDAAQRFPRNDQILVLSASVANMRHDWDTAARRWKIVRERQPGNVASYIGSLTALRGADRMDEAREFFPAASAAIAAAKARNDDPISYLKLEMAIAKVEHDWPVVRRCAQELIAREKSSHPTLLLSLAQACWHLEDVDAADQAAQKTIAAEPRMVEAIIIAAWVASERGDGEKALTCYRKLAALTPKTPRWALKAVQLLNWLGQVDEAVTELESVCERWPNDTAVKSFLKNFGPGSPMTRALAETALAESAADKAESEVFLLLANAAPGEGEWKRPLIVAEPMQDVQVVEVPGAQTAIVVFTGAADGVSMPLSIFDRYLAVLDATAIYVKDFRRLLYFNGIRSLGEDYSSTIEALRKLLHNLGIRRVTAIGNCDGAAASIRYGVELGADRIAAFSPSTHFSETSFSKLEQGRNFKRTRIECNVAPEMTDLKSFLESSASGAQIEVFYKQESERETEHAKRISHVPGVHLHALAGISHYATPQRFALSVADAGKAFAGLLGL